MKKTVLFVAAFSLLLACRKKDDPVVTPPPSGKSNLRVVVDNKVGNDPLVLETGIYQNAAGNTYSVSILKYYLTNFRLRSTSGAYVSVPESYFLLDQATPTSLTLNLPELAAGEYDELSFLIGVDSARNTSGAQTGALDPGGVAGSMFWGWNTGYIMAKIEGSSPQSPAAKGSFAFHMGGFRAPVSVLRQVTLPLPEAAKVQAGRTPEIHLKADLGKWFSGTTTINLSQIYNIMTAGPEATKVADNYATMFSVEHVDN